MTEHPTPGAIMVITAWRQPDTPHHLIARISCTDSHDPTARVHLTATGVDDIADIVHTWLSTLR